MAEEQKQHKPQQRPQAEAPKEVHSASFRYIVRIANTDLDGKRSVLMGLQKIKGVSFMTSHAFSALAKVDRYKKIGDLTEAEIEKLDSLIKTKKPIIPQWMLNRKKDPETGENIHLIGADLTFSQESDIRFLKKIKCFRGVRHMLGQPVRGQRTKSNFRKNKGKVASIKRSVVAKQAAQTKAKDVKTEAKGAKK